MKIMILVPRVVQKFMSQWPEVRNNAYKYFNYDNRVVHERVNRGDSPCRYVGPEQFKDADYDALLTYAKSLENPILKKYSANVAAEDALNMAIRSFGNGVFDGKVNANKFAVLISTLLGMESIHNAGRKKKEAPAEPTKVPKTMLKQLGVSPKELKSKPSKSAPQLVRAPGGVVLHKPEG